MRTDVGVGQSFADAVRWDLGAAHAAYLALLGKSGTVDVCSPSDTIAEQRKDQVGTVRHVRVQISRSDADVDGGRRGVVLPFGPSQTSKTEGSGWLPGGLVSLHLECVHDVDDSG